MTIYTKGIIMHNISKLSIHLVFVVKYRKQLLIKYGNEIKQLMQERSDASKKFAIIEMEVDKDHIHFIIEYLPTESISNIVKQLKSYSVFHIWAKHEVELSRQFWKRKMFWSSGYYVASVGEINTTAIEKYIKTQGTRAQTIHTRS